MASLPTSLCGLVSVLIVSLYLAGMVLSAPSQQQNHHISKRHILQMCELIVNHTNRGCFDYYNYGCYCGLGNAASRHVDGVDGCCRIHDRCYGEVACYWMYPQFVGYSVEWNGDECRCTDSPIFASCQYTTCQCDLEFAKCLARQPYNHGFRNYDRRECNRPSPSVSETRRRRSALADEWKSLVEGNWES